MRRIRPRLTYANVVATIALFGVLAGSGAYAASKIGPKDIKKNAVRSKHVAKKAVKSPKLAGNAVRRGKLASNLRPRWAYVGSGDELRAGRGVVDVRNSGPSGRVVEFDGGYSFANCSAVASPLGGAQGSSATVSSAGDHAVLVNLLDDAGGIVGGPFQLQVVC